MTRLIVLLGFIMLIPIFVAGWTEKSLEFWLTMLKGETVDVPYFLAFILTLFANVFGILFNVITEILKLVI